MEKRSKTKAPTATFPSITAASDGHDISRLVEGLLAVLGRHEAEPDEGVLSLLTAFMQAADRVMEASSPEETEHNRAALAAMLDHGRRFIETWPQHTPLGWRVH